MQADSFGSPTTTTADEALAGINDFAEGLIAYQPRSANVLKAADEHPESALANISRVFSGCFLKVPKRQPSRCHTVKERRMPAP
jgi:hypothetical protein